jgi:hypothetical protein
MLNNNQRYQAAASSTWEKMIAFDYGLNKRSGFSL